MKNHQWSMLAMFGDLTLGMRRIVAVHDFGDEVVGDVAAVLADLFTIYVERGRNNHPCSSLAIIRELAVGMREIVQVHELKDEAVRAIVELIDELFDAYVRRRWWRNNQRSMHDALARELFVGMCEIINAHDLKEEVVSHLHDALESFLEAARVHCRTKEASVQELLDDLCAIYKGNPDEKQPPWRELLDDLLAMHFGRRRKTQKPAYPIMFELLARLERYGSDHEESPSNAAPAVN